MRDRYFCKVLSYLFLLLWLFVPGFSQETDYKFIFGKDWLKAEEFVEMNESWMKPLAEKYRIPYPLALAVIFPELVRYSALRDRIEISLLKTLYINLGEEYANFSIGPFQMKPSFAESVHLEIKSMNDRELRNILRIREKNADLRKYRSSIVEDLEDPGIQFLYLISFIRICEKSYKKEWADEFEKIRFFATVYNCGLNRSPDVIDSMMEGKYFSTKLIKSETYSYPDISHYWYKNFRDAE